MPAAAAAASQVIVYENFRLGAVRQVLNALAWLFVAWFVGYNQSWLVEEAPVGAVTFSAPNSYAVDTDTLGYCSATAVDSCAILEPMEALLARSGEGELFVNTRVTYTYEACTSCIAVGATGWVTPVTSVASTASLYTASKSSDYFVAGVEDFEVSKKKTKCV